MIRANESIRSRDEPEFQPGDLVRHRRYGYRGVVVAVDSECQADEAWYQSNVTQPDRDQPWYHVLVDSTATNTYAAAENLSADPTKAPVDHPLVAVFFSSFVSGKYVRNDTPWP